MPRQYGTTGIVQSATTPATGVGIAGNMYFNTTEGKLYISNGTAWIPYQPSDDGWITCPYAVHVSNGPTAFAGILMLRDNFMLVNDFPKGTRVKITVSGTDYYGVVSSAVAGASGISANPLSTVAYDGTTDVLTKAGHGLNNGDMFEFNTSPPPPFAASVGFFAMNVNAGAGTFQVSSSPTLVVGNLTAGTGNTEIISGTRIDLEWGSDTINRGWTVASFKYSYDLSPPGYPGPSLLAYSSAPAVGVVGNAYYNTTDNRPYISDGTAWTSLAKTTEVEVSGWISSSYAWMPARNNTFLVADYSAGWGGFPIGTRVNCAHPSIGWFGVVTAAGPGSAGISANPLTGVAFANTGDVFTKSGHGLVNGDVIYIGVAPLAGGLVLNVPYFVVNATSTTFQVSGTPGGTVIAITTDGTCEFRTGSYITVAGNADYGLTRGTAMNSCRYSYALCPTLWPGWFNYTTTQTANPLTFTLGYSVIPTSLVYNFRVDGNMCVYNIRDGGNGTSNIGTLSISLPVWASNTPAGALWHGTLAGVDNGASFTGAGGLQVAAGATVVQCFRDIANVGPWTSTGGKRIIRGQIVYGV